MAGTSVYSRGGARGTESEASVSVSLFRSHDFRTFPLKKVMVDDHPFVVSRHGEQSSPCHEATSDARVQRVPSRYSTCIWRLSARCRDAARGACTEHVLTGAASRAIDVSWSAYHVFSARDARHQHPRPPCTPSMMPLGTEQTRCIRWQSTMLEQPDYRAPSVS